MQSEILNPARLAGIKRQLRAQYPTVKSGHLDEAIAAGLGFSRHVEALNASKRGHLANLRQEAVLKRLSELGYTALQASPDLILKGYRSGICPMKCHDFLDAVIGQGTSRLKNIQDMAWMRIAQDDSSAMEICGMQIPFPDDIFINAAVVRKRAMELLGNPEQKTGMIRARTLDDAVISLSANGLPASLSLRRPFNNKLKIEDLVSFNSLAQKDGDKLRAYFSSSFPPGMLVVAGRGGGGPEWLAIQTQLLRDPSKCQIIQELGGREVPHHGITRTLFGFPGEGVIDARVAMAAASDAHPMLSIVSEVPDNITAAAVFSELLNQEAVQVLLKMPDIGPPSEDTVRLAIQALAHMAASGLGRQTEEMEVLARAMFPLVLWCWRKSDGTRHVEVFDNTSTYYRKNAVWEMEKRQASAV